MLLMNVTILTVKDLREIGIAMNAALWGMSPALLAMCGGDGALVPQNRPGCVCRVRKRLGKLHADRAWVNRSGWLRRRGIPARIARYGTASRERLGR